MESQVIRWTGEDNLSWEAEMGILQGKPSVRKLSYERNGEWVVLEKDLIPEFKVITSNGTGISPMSTTGGNMLGYYSACYNPTDEEQQKVFNYFLIETGLVIAIYLIMPLFGVWNINLFH